MAYCVSRLPETQLENRSSCATEYGGTDPNKLRKALSDITGRTAIEERFGRACIWLVGITVLSITWAVNAEYRAYAITRELGMTEAKVMEVMQEMRHER